MKKIFALALSLSFFTLAGCSKQVVPNATVTVEEGEAITECSINGSASSSSSGKKTTKKTTATTAKTETTATTKKVEPPADVIINCTDTLEVYSTVKLSDFITNSNVTLKDGNTLVNTDKLGENTVEVQYSFNGGNFSSQLNYNVVDTTPPLLINTGWDTRHLLGTEFDLNDYVGYGDNYDKKPVLSYTGEVDAEKVGLYPLSATVTDSSGNVSEFDIEIQVLSEIPNEPDETPRVDFKDFVKQYSGDNVRFGIDVSTWQGDIDFQAVKNAGCEFVLMRIGCWYNTYDDVRIDDCYENNIKNAEAAGLDVGVYFYTTDNTPQGIKEHAKWVADKLENRQLDFPVAFDWEDWTTFQEFEMSLHDLNELYSLFNDEMNNYGYSAMLYSSRNLLNTIWNDKSKSIRPVWLAHFTDETDYEGDYAIWQASCYGRIDGIAGDVDMNILYTDKDIS